MPQPVLGPCGGENQPPCPPEPAALDGGAVIFTGEEVELWTREEMVAHGQACFDAGKESVGQSFGARLDAALTASEFTSEDQDKIAVMFRDAFEAAKRECGKQ